MRMLKLGLVAVVMVMAAGCAYDGVVVDSYTGDAAVVGASSDRYYGYPYYYRSYYYPRYYYYTPNYYYRSYYRYGW